ncbi:MAG: glutathione peroxidase [Crocinitomicaceae bacterium]|nr:glutathione peroxidase [Crocinitomicaceae bacterium]
MVLHDFKVKDLKGNDFDFAELKGKKVMVVNTASECGLTPQYTQLQELYEQNKDNDFTVVGFPCNDFGAQEPGSESEIASFCTKNYGVTFPILEKVTVKGAKKHPIYEWILSESGKHGQDEEIQWNFQKFLFDEQGAFVKCLAPTVSPVDDQILTWLNGK